MSCFKGIKELIVAMDTLQRMLETQDPCNVMELEAEADVLCATIKNSIERCNHKRAEARRLGLNRDIGEPSVPVKLGNQIEGFKKHGLWTYRNSNSHNRGFCRKWHMATSPYENIDFDAVYLESIRDEEIKA
jgi:hypothetical protein